MFLKASTISKRKHEVVSFYIKPKSTGQVNPSQTYLLAIEQRAKLCMFFVYYLNYFFNFFFWTNETNDWEIIKCTTTEKV